VDGAVFLEDNSRKITEIVHYASYVGEGAPSATFQQLFRTFAPAQGAVDEK
jgi:hypothetical protein